MTSQTIAFLFKVTPNKISIMLGELDANLGLGFFTPATDYSVNWHWLYMSYVVS